MQPDLFDIGGGLGCDRDYARELMAAHHYLGNVPNNATHVYTVEGAAAIYGPAQSPKIPDSFIVLRRLVSNDQIKTPLSYFLARTLRALRADKWDACVTWADPSYNHHGGIYQATNFIYAEPRSYNWNYSFRKPCGAVVGHREAFSRFGTSSKSKMLEIRPDWVPFLPAMKLRYIKPLKMKEARCLSALDAIKKPFPKPDRDGHLSRPANAQREVTCGGQLSRG